LLTIAGDECMAELDLRGINLRNDIIFKYVFASEDSEDILISLLNAIFEHSKQEKIKDIVYLNPFNTKESFDEKLTVLDIRATDETGRQYNIEMQVRNESQFIERIIYYNSRLLASQLKQGETYSDLKKTITIAITDFKLFPDEKDYHNIYRLLNVKSHMELSGVVEYHFLELPKYKEDKKLEEEIKKWLFTIKNAERFINEPEKLPETIKKEASIMRAIQKMQKAAADNELRAIMEYREKADLDNLQRMKNALREGEKRGEKRGILLGEKKGEKRAKEAIALTMLSLNMSIEDVAKATKLSIEHILKISKNT
jgi:predicted transposase/invertase (TIGR01784 family)